MGSCHPPQGKEVHILQGGPWPTQTLKVGKISPWSPPSGMLKPGWIGRPANWIHPVGGWNLLPSQGWKTHGNLPGRSGPPFQFHWSEAESSQAKGTLHPLPLNASPRICSSQMNCPIRMCNSSLFSQLWPMPKDYSIGQRDSNPLVDPDFYPVVRSVLELKERVKEHMVFSKKDIIQGLGRIDPGTTRQWPQTTPTNLRSGDSGYARVQEAHVTTSLSFGPIPEGRYTIVPSTRALSGGLTDWARCQPY